MQFKQEEPSSRYLFEEVEGETKVSYSGESVPHNLKMIVIPQLLLALPCIDQLVHATNKAGIVHAEFKPETPQTPASELYEYETQPNEFVRSLKTDFQVRLNSDLVVVATTHLNLQIAAQAGKFLVDEFNPSSLVVLSPGQIANSVGVLGKLDSSMREIMTDDYQINPPAFVQGTVAAAFSRALQIKTDALALIVNSEGALGHERIGDDDFFAFNRLVSAYFKLPDLKGQVQDYVSNLYI